MLVKFVHEGPRATLAHVPPCSGCWPVGRYGRRPPQGLRHGIGRNATAGRCAAV